MGKISEILGKRSATISGEATVEVQTTNQQLHTPYAQKGAQHTQGGAEISRDEVPVALQPYVQQYFEQVRKQSAPAQKRGTARVTGNRHLFPDTLGDAAVAIFHPVVLVERGDRSQPLVVQALHSETILKVGFESVQLLEFVGQRRLLLAAGGAEKFLEPPSTSTPISPAIRIPARSSTLTAPPSSFRSTAQTPRPTRTAPPDCDTTVNPAPLRVFTLS